MLSMRQTLTWRLMAGLGLILFALAFFGYRGVKHILLEEFDYALLAKAEALTRVTEPGRDGINLSFTRRVLPEFMPGIDSEFYQVWLRDGTVQARSPSLGTADLPLKAGPPEEPVFFDLELPDGRFGRAVGLGFIEGAAEEEVTGTKRGDFAVIVVFARDTARLQRILGGLLAGIGLTGIGWMAAAWILVRGSIHSGLAPVRRLAQEVTQIGADNLDRKLRAETEELDPIVREFNLLLDRLGGAFLRERRFTANAAHELTTPIAELRALSEAAIQWKEDPEATAGLAQEVFDISQHMDRIVGVLLSLSRCEAGLQKVREERVSLSILLEELRTRFQDRAEKKGVSWSWAIPPDVVVQSDSILLRTILSNLFENALEYTPAGGEVHCHMEVLDGGGWEVTVTNTNPGLVPEEIPNLVEPLWRKDTARSDRSHAGLGLALVNAFSRMLHLHFQIRLSEADTAVEVKLLSPSTTSRGRHEAAA